MHSKEVFTLYEQIRDVLPQCESLKQSLHVNHTEALLEHARCFFLDAFGVLNVGQKAVCGAHRFLTLLRENNLPFLILSNSASVPKTHLWERFIEMGFSIEPHEIVTSREVLWSLLKPDHRHWGIIGTRGGLEIPLRTAYPDEEMFWESEQFLFLGTQEWNDALQVRWKNSLLSNPRDIWVTNPDLSAPRGNGTFSKEPGFYTLLEPRHLFNECTIVGKPFASVFSHALCIAKKRWGIASHDVMMVGDTLHTDILGANAIGMKSALIEGYGFFKGLDPLPFMESSGIFPDIRLAHYTQ
jgi:ribonucleotide monophosphatase NagD (HAD superfamily)